MESINFRDPRKADEVLKKLESTFQALEDMGDKAWGVITKMIDERIRYLFHGLKTPSPIIAKAEELYGSKDPVRYRQRLEDLSEFKFVGGSVEGHLAEVRGMIASLRSFTSDPILPAQELNLLAVIIWLL